MIPGVVGSSPQGAPCSVGSLFPPAVLFLTKSLKTRKTRLSKSLKKYLFVRARAQAGARAGPGAEAGSAPSREPGAGLGPRTPQQGPSRRPTRRWLGPGAPKLDILSPRMWRRWESDSKDAAAAGRGCLRREGRTGSAWPAASALRSPGSPFARPSGRLAAGGRARTAASAELPALPAAQRPAEAAREPWAGRAARLPGASPRGAPSPPVPPRKPRGRLRVARVRLGALSCSGAAPRGCCSPTSALRGRRRLGTHQPARRPRPTAPGHRLARAGPGAGGSAGGVQGRRPAPQRLRRGRGSALRGQRRLQPGEGATPPGPLSARRPRAGLQTRRGERPAGTCGAARPRPCAPTDGRRRASEGPVCPDGSRRSRKPSSGG